MLLRRTTLCLFLSCVTTFSHAGLSITKTKSNEVAQIEKQKYSNIGGSETNISQYSQKNNNFRHINISNTAKDKSNEYFVKNDNKFTQNHHLSKFTHSSKNDDNDSNYENNNSVQQNSVEKPPQVKVTIRKPTSKKGLTLVKNATATEEAYRKTIEFDIASIPDHDDYSERHYSEQHYSRLNRVVTDYVLPSVNNGGFIRPVNYSINSPFGMRFHPIHKKMQMHTGVDFAAPMGTPIKAAMAGVVVFSGLKGGYGNAVIIKHDDKYMSLYGHASKLNVSVGEFVKQGQTVALVGSTGHSTGPHLHFEIFEYGKRVNPATRIPAKR